MSDRSGVVFERGYGFANVERRVPFVPATATDGGSLAKTFTAALLLGMQEDGSLDLDAPARTWLPELPYPGVTLRHLLSHSSGIPVLDYDYFDPYLGRDEVRTTEQLLRVLAENKPPLAAPPGTAFEYSSFGFDLAALAAERAGGKSYFELLEERFFRPLRIASAFVRPGRLSEFPGVRTLAYRHAGAGLELNDVFDREAFHGGSNLYLSARELDRWSTSFLRAPPLAPKALALALEPARIAGGTSGLTLGSWYRSADGTSFWYSGHLQGFHSEALRNLWRGWSVVYVSNNTIEPWLQKGIVRAVTEILEGRSPRPLTAPAVSPFAREERAALAGLWTLSGGEGLVIESSGGRIDVARDAIRYRVFQIAPDAFYVPGLDFILGFAKGDDGAPARIYVSTNLEERWGSRR